MSTQTAFIVLNRDTIDRFCERSIAAVVLAILVVGPLAFGGVGAIGFSVLQGLTIVAMLLWAVRLAAGQKQLLLWPPICWGVAAFALYAVGRYHFADIEWVAREEMIRVLVYAFLFFIIVNQVHRQQAMQIICITVVFLGMLIAAYALFQFVTHSNRVWNLEQSYGHRASGTYISPNHLGGFLEMALPLGISLALTGRIKPMMRIFLGYAVLVIMGGMVVTVSRGTWIAGMAGVTFLFGVLAFQRSFRWVSIGLFAVCLVAGVVLLPKNAALRLRTKALYSTGRLDDDARFTLWRPAVQLWHENPWWGVGPNHFDYRFRMYRPPAIQLQPDRVHNDFLNTLTDWGIVGALLVGGALTLLAWNARATWAAVRPPVKDLGGMRTSNKTAIVLGAGAGLIGLLCHSLVDFNMSIPANAILAVTLMALLSAHSRFASDNYWRRINAAMKVTMLLVLALGGIYLTWQEVRRGRETYWLEKAYQAKNFSAEQIVLLKRAIVAEPNNPHTAFAIGEAYRHESQEGGESYEGGEQLNYRDLAGKAMEWYARSMKLDRWNPSSWAGYGWCLDWLERKNESGQYFWKAEELDPNGYFTANQMGIHYMESGNPAAGRTWFDRSLRLQWNNNRIAESYLAIANRTLLEGATNDLASRLKLPAAKKE